MSDDSGYPLDDPKNPTNAGASKGLRESLATSGGLRRGSRVVDVKTGQTGTLIASQQSKWKAGYVLCLVRLDGDDLAVNPVVRWGTDIHPARDPSKPERRG